MNRVGDGSRKVTKARRHWWKAPGVRAIGISGKDGGFCRRWKETGDEVIKNNGLRGDVKEVNADILYDLRAAIQSQRATMTGGTAGR